jgi:hypothetical protein
MICLTFSRPPLNASMVIVKMGEGMQMVARG